MRKWNADDQNLPEITPLIQFLSEVEMEDGQEFLAASALQQIKFNNLGAGLEQKERIVR